MNKQEQELKQLLGNWRWRLTSWKLYKIKDKNGNVVSFIPNKYQLKLISWLHYKNLILKARQLGFSTLIQILLLDQALFSNNKACGIIAHTRNDAEAIFKNKVKFAYNNLPDWLKKERTIVANSSDTLEFNNGSYIYVSTSFRWGTLQYLHISEFGKICAKEPLKAKEIVDGAIEAVGKWCYIFIESTAEWHAGYFYDYCKRAEALQQSWKILNELEMKFFFYPWWDNEEYQISDNHIVITQETDEYFNHLTERLGIEFTNEQKAWYQLKKWEKGDSMWQEYPSYSEEAFQVSMEWTYYTEQIKKVREENRYCRVPYDPALQVNLSFDLWWASWKWDDTAIWFYQVAGKEVRFIDYFETNSLNYHEIHSQVLQEKWYRYGTVYLPHDANITDASSEFSLKRYQVFENLGYNVEVLPRVARVIDWINQVREQFRNCRFDNKNCEDAFNSISEYRKKIDPKTWVDLWPLHNQVSHCADSFRYAIQSLEHKRERPQTRVVVPDYLNNL